MVTCLMCVKEKGESKDFDFLNLHLSNQHGMTPKHYLQIFPNANLTSRRLRNQRRKTMFETYKKHPDMNEKKNKWRDEIRERPINYDDLDFDYDTLEALKERKRYYALALISGISKGEAYKNAYANFLEAKDMLNFLLTGERTREHPREELHICKPDTSCRKTKIEKEKCTGCINDRKEVTLNLTSMYRLHPYEKTLISALIETLVHKSIQLSLRTTDGEETSRCFEHVINRYRWF